MDKVAGGLPRRSFLVLAVAFLPLRVYPHWPGRRPEPGPAGRPGAPRLWADRDPAFRHHPAGVAPEVRRARPGPVGRRASDRHARAAAPQPAPAAPSGRSAFDGGPRAPAAQSGPFRLRDCRRARFGRRRLDPIDLTIGMAPISRFRRPGPLNLRLRLRLGPSLPAFHSAIFGSHPPRFRGRHLQPIGLAARMAPIADRTSAGDGRGTAPPRALLPTILGASLARIEHRAGRLRRRGRATCRPDLRQALSSFCQALRSAFS